MVVVCHSLQANDLYISFAGSVNGSNCVELAKKEDIDGFLVGGASLKVYSHYSFCFIMLLIEGNYVLLRRELRIRKYQSVGKVLIITP